jgi:hypothetical protein
LVTKWLPLQRMAKMSLTGQNVLQASLDAAHRQNEHLKEQLDMVAEALGCADGQDVVERAATIMAGVALLNNKFSGYINSTTGVIDGEFRS